MTITAPLLENDYLSAALVAETLYASNSYCYVTGTSDFMITQQHSFKVSFARGTAWVGGTAVEGTPDPISLPTTDAAGARKIIVLRCVFDGETLPEVRLVDYAINPKATGGNGSTAWTQSPGECMDLPLAVAVRETSSWRLTDVRLIKRGASFELPSRYTTTHGLRLLPPGTPVQHENALKFFDEYGVLRDVTMPESLESWMPLPTSVVTANARHGTDVSNLRYSESQGVVRVTGQIKVAAGETGKLTLPVKPAISNSGFCVGYYITTPIFVRINADASAPADLMYGESYLPVGQWEGVLSHLNGQAVYIDVDFTYITEV